MAVRSLKEPSRNGMKEHFAPSDPQVDLTRYPLVSKILKSRKFQFLFILPNQLIFWFVIVAGLFGAAVPTRNFATVITWYIWFCVVFLLMVGVGRGWCLMCPFGGFAEWVQRRTFFKRHKFSLTLGLKWPKKLSNVGIMSSVVVFIVLTWFEEFYNIAGPGKPLFTSLLVFGVIGIALVTFLIFERRTFCRYLCPLTALIGTVGSTGMVAGFRTKDRDVCLTCETKDCMRGSENGYGCPWYEWPGSATSNLACGLCSECFKNCPKDNVGLFVQKPLTSLISPVNRRFDVALAILSLFGLVLFQQLNAMPFYVPLDNWLNHITGFPGYPNPIDYLGIIALVTLACIGFIAVVRFFSGVRNGGSIAHKIFAWITPIAYGLTPIVASDYLARQLPRFFDHALRIIPAISDPFALGWNLFGTAHSTLYNAHLLSTNGVIGVQVGITAVGGLAAAYVTTKIMNRDMKHLTNKPLLMKSLCIGFVILSTVAVAGLYIAMGGAQ